MRIQQFNFPVPFGTQLLTSREDLKRLVDGVFLLYELFALDFQAFRV